MSHERMPAALRPRPSVGCPPHHHRNDDSFPSTSRKKRGSCQWRAWLVATVAQLQRCQPRAHSSAAVSRAMLTTIREPHFRLVLVLVLVLVDAVAVCRTGTPVPRSPASRLCERWGKGCVSLGCSPYTYLHRLRCGGVMRAVAKSLQSLPVSQLGVLALCIGL
ncbi:hypothetical protein IWX46DRAFT_280475 [Phyllosticta citricarpa]|uniref:Uncharacterized protein n=1 Tax=Phyllosticta citricarpa TaxID=55181 RepID=A0ABR1MLU5_9PEZI